MEQRDLNLIEPSSSPEAPERRAKRDRGFGRGSGGRSRRPTAVPTCVDRPSLIYRRGDSALLGPSKANRRSVCERRPDVRASRRTLQCRRRRPALGCFDVSVNATISARTPSVVDIRLVSPTSNCRSSSHSSRKKPTERSPSSAKSGSLAMERSCPLRAWAVRFNARGSREKKVLHPKRAAASRCPREARSVPPRSRESRPERPRFLDESGCNVAMTASYGRAPVGVRVAESKPANWGTTSPWLAPSRTIVSSAIGRSWAR